MSCSLSLFEALPKAPLCGPASCMIHLDGVQSSGKKYCMNLNLISWKFLLQRHHLTSIRLRPGLVIRESTGDNSFEKGSLLHDSLRLPLSELPLAEVPAAHFHSSARIFLCPPTTGVPVKILISIFPSQRKAQKQNSH